MKRGNDNRVGAPHDRYYYIKNIWRVCLRSLACSHQCQLTNEFTLLTVPRIVLSILGGREGVKVEHDHGLPKPFEDLIFYLDCGGYDKGGDL